MWRVRAWRWTALVWRARCAALTTCQAARRRLRCRCRCRCRRRPPAVELCKRRWHRELLTHTMRLRCGRGALRRRERAGASFAAATPNSIRRYSALELRGSGAKEARRATARPIDRRCCRRRPPRCCCVPLPTTRVCVCVCCCAAAALLLLPLLLLPLPLLLLLLLLLLASAGVRLVRPHTHPSLRPPR